MSSENIDNIVDSVHETRFYLRSGITQISNKSYGTTSTKALCIMYGSSNTCSLQRLAMHILVWRHISTSTGGISVPALEAYQYQH